MENEKPTPAPASEHQSSEATQQPEEALYQPTTEFEHVDDSWPACLQNPKSGFWDNPTFI